MKSTRLILATLVGALVVTNGCAKRAATPVEAAREVVERGPLKLVVEACPRALTVGDTITINLTLDTPADYTVTLPTADDFRPLEAKQTEAPEPRPGPAGLTWRRSFTITPLASGPLEIPALAARYGRAGRPADSLPPSTLPSQPPTSELATPPLKLEVRSVLTPQDQPTQPRDITGTLLPPKPPLPLWQKLAWAGGILAAAALAYVAFRLVWTWVHRPPPPIAPEIRALRALAELADGDWPAERLREFYYRLTEIVRAYIESKFGLAAPEMTTEEFLATLARDRRALPYDPDRLRSFLEACDFVKYAALRPRREDADAGLSTARAFIHATAAAGSAAPAAAHASEGAAA